MAGRNSIYEVFRACRLCGGGGGYKMPIVNLEDELDMRHKIRECVRIEVHRDDKMPPLICELCVDKVNDYFEFLEMCRATDTKTRIRLGLPQVSHMQTFGNDSGDCILGVTEPVFVNEDSNDGEPLARQKNRLVVGAKGKKSAAQPPGGKKRSSSPIPVISIARTGLKDSKTGLKGLKVSINGAQDAGSSRSPRSSRAAPTPPTKKGGRRDDTPPATRGGKREVSPPATRGGRRDITPPATRGARRDVTPQSTRGSRRDDSRDNKKTKAEKERRRSPPRPPPPPARKKEEPRTLKSGLHKPGPLSRSMSVAADDKSLLREKTKVHGKRVREREDDARFAKKPKIVAKPGPASKAEKRRAPSPLRPESKRRAPEPTKKTPEPPRKPAETYPCTLCKATFSKPSAVGQHMKAVHSPTFTSDKLACNACGEWFRSADEAGTHHRWHKSASPYICRLCTAEFKQYISFSKHFANKQCVPSTEVPDEQCAECWLYFPTKPLMVKHKCRGEEGRPGGNCAKCGRKYATHKTLKKHEESCFKPGPKSKVVTVSPEIQRRLQPMRVRVARCDPLLTQVKQEKHYDVSHVKRSYGLDKTCVYPYISSVRSIKNEPNDYDLSRVKNEYDDFDYQDNFNYESYTDSDSEPELVESEPNLVRNPFARKKKSVDALSTLSIKAIFSTRFLGQKKIQRKRLRRLKMKEEIKSELMDKEAKRELIENLNGVDDLNADKDKSVDKDSATEDAVGEKDTTEKTTEVSAANEVNAFGETDLFDDDNQNVSLAVDDLIADLNKIDDIVPQSEKDKEDTSQEAINENEVTKETVNEKDSSKVTDTVNEKVADDQESKVADFDVKDTTKVIIKDEEPSGTDTEVSKVLGENEKTPIETETSAVTDDKEASEVTDNKETGAVTAIDGKPSKENDESTPKMIVDGEIVSTETNTVTDSVKVDEKSLDIEKNSSTNAEQTLKEDEQSAKIETEQQSTKSQNDTPEVTSKMDVEEDEFDINSMFSGDLGATALKAKGQLAHADEKNDSEVEKVNEVQATKLSTPEKLKTKAELKQPTKDSAPTEHTSTAKTVTDKPAVDENEETPVDRSEIDTETPAIDVRLGENEPNIKNNDLESDKVQNYDIESGVLRKDEPETGSNDDSQKGGLEKTEKLEKCISDTDLENISDSEMMDDKELMDELDAQISENTKPEERGNDKESLAEKKTEPEEKISLDELLMASAEVTDKTTNEKLRESMDLDTISDDEYNFDA